MPRITSGFFTTVLLVVALLAGMAISAQAQSLSTAPSLGGGVLSSGSRTLGGGSSSPPGLSSPSSLPPGADKRVVEAMFARAEALQAYDNAVIEEIIRKPDSVLALTCFEQVAGLVAKNGGNIFSGDFTLDLKPLIEQTLQNFYQNFLYGTGGSLVPPSVLSAVYNCTEMDKVWQKASIEGINRKAPYIMLDNLLTGTPPAGAGPDFLRSWNASKSQGVFSNFKAKMDALPRPSVPDYSAAKSSCDVLKIAGIVTTCS